MEDRNRGSWYIEIEAAGRRRNSESRDDSWDASIVLYHDWRQSPRIEMYKIHVRNLWGHSAGNNQEITWVGWVRRKKIQMSTRKVLTLSSYLRIPITVWGRAMCRVEAESDCNLGAVRQDFLSISKSSLPLLSIGGSLDVIGSSGDSTQRCFSPPEFSDRLPPMRTPPPITRQVTGKKFFSLSPSDSASITCDMVFSAFSLFLSPPIRGLSSFTGDFGPFKQLWTMGEAGKILVSCMLYSDTHQYNHRSRNNKDVQRAVIAIRAFVLCTEISAWFCYVRIDRVRIGIFKAFKWWLTPVLPGGWFAPCISLLASTVPSSRLRKIGISRCVPWRDLGHRITSMMFIPWYNGIVLPVCRTNLCLLLVLCVLWRLKVPSDDSGFVVFM